MLPDVFRQFRNIERVRAGLHVQCNQSDQGDERAQAQVKRDLERGVVLPFAAAPDANHDERRHQREFMQEIKEEQIQRREGAEDAPAHHQQQDVKFLLAFLDFPRATRRGEGDDGAHQNQPDVQAVHADVITDAEGFDPRDLLHKAVAVGVHRRVAIGAEHFHGEHRRNEGGEQGDGADDDAVIARHQNQRQRRHERPAQNVGQNGHFIFPKRNTSPPPRRARTGRHRSGGCRSGPAATRARSNPCRRAPARCTCLPPASGRSNPSPRQ